MGAEGTEVLPQRAAVGGEAELVLPRHSYAVTHRFDDMSETAAGALREVARYTHAVPARQQTLRLGMIVAVIAPAAAFLAWMIYLQVSAGRDSLVVPLLTAFVTVLGILGAGPIIDAVLKRIRKAAAD